MKGNRAASRYAKSLLDLAIEQKTAEEAKKDMQFISGVIDDNKDLALLLKSPVVKPDKKEAVLNAVFKGKIQDLSMSFINIIVKKGRESMLKDITRAFDSQYKIHNNIATAVVTTAIAMDDDLRAKVKAMIKEAEGRQVDMIEEVDKDLIGGLIVKIGDKQVDASVARQLNELKQKFSKNPYIADY